MLYSIDGKQITNIPRRRQEQFNIWQRALDDSDHEAVVEAINEYVNAVDSDKPFVSSYIPGPDWTDTVYQPLYIACGESEEQSGWFFGLLVWQVMIDHEEDWVFKPADSDDDVMGTTYWRRNRQN